MIILTDAGLKEVAAFGDVRFDGMKFKCTADLLTLVFTLEGVEAAHTMFQIPSEDVTVILKGIEGFLPVHKEVN